jgi:hypothetical protein
MAQFPLPPLTIGGTAPPPAPPPPSPPRLAALGSVREIRAYDVPRLADLCLAKINFVELLEDACGVGDIGMIQKLIECGADPDTFVSDPFDPTAGSIPILAYACVLGDAALVEGLLRHGATPGRWMMADAFACGHDKVVSIMSQHVGIDTLDHRTRMSLLETACYLQNVHAVERLLLLGAKVESQGIPPLIWAFQRAEGDPLAQRQIMERLLDAGADIETGHRGLTPLGLACMSNNIEAVSLLLERGANPNALVGHVNILTLCCKPAVNVPIFAKLLHSGARLPWQRGLELIGDGDDEISVRKRHYFIMAWHMEVNRPVQKRYYLS